MTAIERIALIAASHQRLKRRARVAAFRARQPRPPGGPRRPKGTLKRASRAKQKRQQELGPVGIPPTPKQLYALRFTADYIAAHGQAPRMDEIQASMRTTSSHTMCLLLQRCAAKGLLTWIHHVPRSLQLTEAGLQAIASGVTSYERLGVSPERMAVVREGLRKGARPESSGTLDRQGAEPLDVQGPRK